MALKAGYKGIKKIGTGLNLTTEGTLSLDGSGPGGSVNLDDLGDVAITDPADGNILVYDSTNEKWKNVVPTSAADKADITAIGTNETGNTASKAYAVGEHFYKNGKFCTVIASIAQGVTFTLNTNYVEGTIADYINPPSINEMVSPTEGTGTRFNVVEGGYKQRGKHIYVNILIKQNKTNFPEMLVGDLSTGNTGYDTGLINFPTPKNHGGVSFTAVFLNKSPSAAENARKTRYGYGLATIYEELVGYGQMSLYTYHAIPSSLTDDIFVQIIGEYECA